MNRMFGHLSNLTLILSGVFLFAMMIHVSADVALKYAINRPIPGTLEIVSAYYMVAGVFLPIAAVELARASIQVDAAYQFMPRYMKVFCMALVLGLSAAVYFVLAYTSWGDAMRSYSINEQMMGQVFITVWPSRFVLPISFFLAGSICIFYLYQFFTDKTARDMLMDVHDPEEEEFHG